MAKPKVHIYMPVDETGKSHKLMEDAGADVIAPDEGWMTKANASEKTIIKLEPGAVAGMGVAALSFQVTRETMAACPDLRIISKYTVGVDNVDVEAATEMGILVTHCPTEANFGAVAEGTMAFILTMLKRVRERDRYVKEGGWRNPELIATYLGRRQLDPYGGITIGIIGLGRIGSRLADLLAPWRVRLLAYDPYIDESKFVHHDARSVDLETLLRESDVVTLHTNLTEETRNMINAERLALMKPTAILVNAARGPIVDIDALYDALVGDKLAGACLDVLPEEPPAPQSPIRGLGDKVILSPHQIAHTRGGGLQPAVPWATDAVLSALRGEVPRHVFNEDVIPLWKERFSGKNLLT